MDDTLSNNNNPKYGVSEHTGSFVDDDPACNSVTQQKYVAASDIVENCDFVSCASISQTYCLEWDRLFTARDYMREIRSLAMCGKLRSCRFRSMCWKLFLEVLPEAQSQWVNKTVMWRKQYEELKDQMIVNPRNAEAKDLSINNPLSQEVESPWNQFFLDNELRLTIKQDVIRTFPEISFFKDDSVREVLMNVLFCYARAHSELEYKQGMHELLAPLIFVLHCDHQAFLHACELENVRDVVKQLMDPKYLEHDAYTLFSQIMETVEPWYVSKEIVPVVKRSEILRAEPFTRPPEVHPSNVIVTKLTRIQEYLLRRFDSQLHERLQSLDIAPQIYGIRWVRLLFGREFPMQDLLMLWDAIFADSFSFDLVDYVFVAMLLYIKEAMMLSDYASCLHMLMKYPPIADMQYFIDMARYLREPNEQPKPTEYSYQQPHRYAVNGWTTSSSHPPKVGGGSLGSSVSHGLSSAALSTRRPGSLVIGAAQMSKSSSEPMNLITDTVVVSPNTAATVYQDESCMRKGSTASLSYIEGALNQSARSVGVRANSSQNLMQSSTDAWYSDGDHPTNVASTTGDGVTSPVSTTSTKSTGRFFVFGGTRTARKQRQKNGEPDAGRVMTSVNSTDNVCRRCATELDIHIGTLQKHLLKQDQRSVDDVLVALAGLKQVRDVLKGALKPTCLSDTESELAGYGYVYGWTSAALVAAGVKRQLSEGSAHSAQSSQSTTPVHEPKDGCGGSGRFYVTTPDLLSSDTDVTSPENPVSGARNTSNGAAENGPLVLRNAVKQPDDERTSEMNHHTSNQFDDTKVVDIVSNQLSEPQYSLHCTNQAAADHRPPVVGRSSFTRDIPDRHEMTMDKDGSRPADNRSPGFRFRASDAPSDHQRDSSPINRLAGLFKNLAKF